MKSHKDLDVYKKSMDLVEEIYSVTKEFPKAEKFGLISQMQRAAISIPSNIAEGSARHGRKENIQFLYISLGSLAEIETQLEIAIRLKYVNYAQEIEASINEIRRMLLGLISYLKRTS